MEVKDRNSEDTNMRPTLKQRRWADNRVGTPIKIHSHMNATVVDWKMDVGGIGVFFIATDRFNVDHEVYRMFPPALRPIVPRLRGGMWV